MPGLPPSSKRRQWLTQLFTLAASASAPLGALALQTASPAAGPRPELLLLGVHHFHNPGQDVARQAADDILAPARQHELARVLDTLARFAPELIAVEEPPERAAALEQRYQDWRAGRRALGRNETEQLGFRLRQRLDLPALQGIDWNGMPPGDLNLYDYEAWAEAQAQAGSPEALQRLRASRAALQAWASQADQVLQQQGLIAALRLHNDPARLAESHRRYFDYLALGDTRWAAGPNYLGHWMTRNLRLFQQLSQAAAGQRRVLLIIGAGHVPLLQRYAEVSGRFYLARTLDWLPN